MDSLKKGDSREDISLRRQAREIECLSRISEALSSSLDLRSTLKEIFQILSEDMGMSRGTLTLLNPRTGELAIETASLTKNSKEDATAWGRV